MKSLTEDEQRQRARQIKLLLCDCDGVLTDAGVYYSAKGEELKRFSMRDGMGIKLLRELGVETAIITREASAFAARRAEKLSLSHVYLGIWDKVAELPKITQDSGAELHQMAYIGDDVNDYEIMNKISNDGLTATPGDGMEQIREVAHYVCKKNGGNGAVREFADWIRNLRAG